VCRGITSGSRTIASARWSARRNPHDYERRERLDERDVAGHATRLLAAVHASAWTWRRKGFGLEEFINEGRRIGAAATLADQ
jgi:hypothetical protein